MIEDDKKNINTEEENTESTNQEIRDDNVVSDKSLNKTLSTFKILFLKNFNFFFLRGDIYIFG